MKQAAVNMQMEKSPTVHRTERADGKSERRVCFEPSTLPAHGNETQTSLLHCEEIIGQLFFIFLILACPRSPAAECEAA